MNVYGSILPGAATVAKLLPRQASEARIQAAVVHEGLGLSPAAKHRLKVVRWQEKRGGNITRTADHFSHSRTTIQSWCKRYKARGAGRPRGQQPPPAQSASAHLVNSFRAASA
jgi:hypothetical protein